MATANQLRENLRAATTVREILFCLANWYWFDKHGVEILRTRVPLASDLGKKDDEIIAIHKEWIASSGQHGLTGDILLFYENDRRPVDTRETTILPFDLARTRVSFGEENISHLPTVSRIERKSIVPVMEWLDVQQGDRAQRMKLFSKVQQLYILLSTAVPPVERKMRYYPLEISLSDLVFWFWPEIREDPKLYRPYRHLPQIIKVLNIAETMRILPDDDPGFRAWKMITFWQLPTGRTSLDTLLDVGIYCSPESYRGPLVVRSDLSKWISDPIAFRTYVRLLYFWDAVKGRKRMRNVSATVPRVLRDKQGYILGPDGKHIYSHTRQKVRDYTHAGTVPLGDDGKLASATNPQGQMRNRDADRVPAFDGVDILRLTHGHSAVDRDLPKQTRSRYRQEGKKALLALAQEKDVVFERADGKVRILPAWNEKLKK